MAQESQKADKSKTETVRVYAYTKKEIVEVGKDFGNPSFNGVLRELVHFYKLARATKERDKQDKARYALLKADNEKKKKTISRQAKKIKDLEKKLAEYEKTGGVQENEKFPRELK